MTQQDQEIIQLAQRIASLSSDPAGRGESVMSTRLAKIQELANVLLPRLEERYNQA